MTRNEHFTNEERRIVIKLKEDKSYREIAKRSAV